jgi:hypothetical protein
MEIRINNGSRVGKYHVFYKKVKGIFVGFCGVGWNNNER